MGKRRFHLTRKTKFLLGLAVLLFMYCFPLYLFITAPSWFLLSIASWTFLSVVTAVFALAGWLLYKVTIKKVKIDYPLTSPSGQVDIYEVNTIPRPIYEDMEQYPWFFKKKRNRKKIEKGNSKPEHCKC